MLPLNTPILPVLALALSFWPAYSAQTRRLSAQLEEGRTRVGELEQRLAASDDVAAQREALLDGLRTATKSLSDGLCDRSGAVPFCSRWMDSLHLSSTKQCYFSDSWEPCRTS